MTEQTLEATVVNNPPTPTIPKIKREKPTPEEIEERRKLKQLEVVPEGFSRKQWKRELKKQRWQDTKQEYLEVQREKKRLARQRKRERLKDLDENDELRKAQPIPSRQISTNNVSVIIDCDFDELMHEKEIVSLSNQIKACYSAMRHCTYKLPIQITSFNKRLKQRFEAQLHDYHLWQGNISFTDRSLTEYVTGAPNSESKDNDGNSNSNTTNSTDTINTENLVYLTADTDEEITKLEPNHTYIIGGIVDKNRHKQLCYNKAKELGIKVARLPIGKYIEMNGRHVLVTSHVYELLCKWFENDGDWETAFNKVLPPRKIKLKSPSQIYI